MSLFCILVIVYWHFSCSYFDSLVLQIKYFYALPNTYISYAYLVFFFFLHWPHIRFDCYCHAIVCRAPCVTCCGLTPMTVVAGAFPRGVPGTPLGRTSARPSTTPTASRSCRGPTNSSWRATTGATTAMSSPSSLLPTTAIGVAIKLRLWNLMTLSSIHCKYTYRCKWKKKRFLFLFFIGTLKKKNMFKKKPWIKKNFFFFFAIATKYTQYMEHLLVVPIHCHILYLIVLSQHWEVIKYIKR